MPPSASARSFVSTVTDRSLLAKRFVLTVNINAVLPESPSFKATSSIEIVAESSLTIVPKPLLSAMDTRVASTLPSKVAADKSTVNVSSISTI